MSTTTTTTTREEGTTTDPATAPRSWIWPLPRLDGVAPCILPSRFGHLRSDGIAIGYPGRSSFPGLVPVFAAQDGVIARAGTSLEGAALSIDHADGWSTHYAELALLLARPTDRSRRRHRERVRAGDVIGHASRSRLRIWFGLSRLTAGTSIAHDPAQRLPAWGMLPWFGDPIAPRPVMRAAV